jgi:hypothetical protein
MNDPSRYRAFFHLISSHLSQTPLHQEFQVTEANLINTPVKTQFLRYLQLTLEGSFPYSNREKNGSRSGRLYKGVPRHGK